MIEIERKFLMTPEQFNALPHCQKERLQMLSSIDQGYLVNSPGISVRIRIEHSLDKYIGGTRAVICIKKNIDDSMFVRSEESYEIPVETAEYILKDLDGVVMKTRWTYGGYTIDVFHDALTGLIIAEKEYDTLEDAMKDSVPDWVTKEVTADENYLNSNLATKKFIKNS